MLCAILGETITPDDPFATDPLNDLAPPSSEHLFGTDRVGRDVLSRVILGARDILIVAPAATLLATVVGTALGLVTGYYLGWVDNVLSRFIDAFLALPTVIIGLLVITAVGASKLTVILVVGLVFAPVIARTVRAAVLQERGMEYVAAAKLRNEKTPYVLFAEILPNVMGPVMVEFTVRLGYAIFTVATLSFLGLGIQPPAPDWGLQVFEGYGADQRRLLVAGAVPVAGHRQPRDRSELDRRRHRKGVRAMSAAPTATAHALELSDVEVDYRVRGQWKQVLRGVSLHIAAGESFGLVGESGCGKSTAAFAALRYLPRNGRVSKGSISVAGEDLLAMSDGDVRRLRAERVSMVYQNPTSALNPTLKIGEQVAESFELQGVSDKESGDRTQAILEKVQISDPTGVMGRYPHQLSGGMNQRVVIAMALAKDPTLLILDEPTTGLDATVEAEVLDLVSALRAEFETSVLFISHSLDVIAKMCDRVGVLYAGPARRAGRRRRRLQQPAPSVHGRPAALHPARRRDQGAGQARHHPRLPARPRRGAARPACTPTAAGSRRRSATTRSRRCTTSAAATAAAATSTTRPRSSRATPSRSR